MTDDRTGPDPLRGLVAEPFTAEARTYDVYRAGSGPAVIVMAEIPGITPRVADFARFVVDAGFTVFLPVLFGRPGDPPDPWPVVRSVVPACVSKEFAAFATGSTARVTGWLRALGAHAHEECGGPGIGALGMCFTGGFALGMMVDDRMLAPVLSQPSLPIGVSRRHRADLHLSPEDLARVKARAAAGTCVLGFRFTGDPMAPPERFETLRRELGDAFVGVEIDSSKGNPWGFGRVAHSVLTEELVTDDPDHPTARALAQVLEFFRDRLLTA